MQANRIFSAGESQKLKAVTRKGLSIFHPRTSADASKESRNADFSKFLTQLNTAVSKRILSARFHTQLALGKTIVFEYQQQEQTFHVPAFLISQDIQSVRTFIVSLVEQLARVINEPFNAGAVLDNPITSTILPSL